MVLKGIERGDSKFRHFTFDDSDVTVQNGVSYYKVNYGKDKSAGDFAEDEMDFIPCEKVMVLGGKKPAPPTVKLPTLEKEKVVSFEKTDEPPVTGQVQILKRKPGRPKKNQEVKTDNVTHPEREPVPDGASEFEYLVHEMRSDNVGGLQNSLNELGKEGWEMCGFDMNKSVFNNIHIIAIFKRRK